MYSQGYGFSGSHIRIWQLDHQEGWAPNNWCFHTVVLEKTLEGPLDCKESQPVHPKGNQFLNIHWKDWCWNWSSNTLATWYKEPAHWKRPWCWERLKAGGEGDNRGWDGWMASLTQWTGVWANSGTWWRTAGVPQSMESQSWTWLSDWTTQIDIIKTARSFGFNKTNKINQFVAWFITKKKKKAEITHLKKELMLLQILV